MNEAVPVTDFLGRAIQVGDWLVYPVRQGSKMWLSRIRVTHVLPGPTPTVRGLNPESRAVTLHKLANAVVVARPQDERDRMKFTQGIVDRFRAIQCDPELAVACGSGDPERIKAAADALNIT